MRKFSRKQFLRATGLSIGAVAGARFVAACGGAPSPPTPPASQEHGGTATAMMASPSEGYWPVEQWMSSSPENQGMDSHELVRLFDTVDRSKVALRSVLVVRHGYLVLEAYAPQLGPDSCQPIYSCTKSLTSALVGMVLDKGYLSSIHSPMLDFFPDRQCANPDPRKRAITLEHLLTMTPGVDWWELIPFDSRNTLMQMERSADWVQFFLDRPVSADPGTLWTYNSGAVHVLAAIVQQKSGKTLADFAARNLLAPLGISSVSWPADGHGISYGYRGVYMTARDMARFGYLYLREGVWDGRRIISSAWVKASMQRRVTAWFGQGYAYLWWVPVFGGCAANGYQGQRIFVIPEQDLVVVITAAIGSQAMMTQPENLVGSFILPAVKSSQPLPENRTGAEQLEERVRAFGGQAYLWIR